MSNGSMTLAAGVHPGGSEWQRLTAPPRTFTITFTGTPTFDEDREARRCSVCGEIRSAEPGVFPCRCAMLAANTRHVTYAVPTFDVRDPAQREAFSDAILGGFDTPAACTCADKDMCTACADEPARARTHDVFFNIEVKACSDTPGWYIAQSDQFSQYGDGATPYEALTDFFACMAEHMDDLETHEDILGRGLTRELSHLRALAGNNAL